METNEIVFDEKLAQIEVKTNELDKLIEDCINQSQENTQMLHTIRVKFLQLQILSLQLNK